MFAREHPVIFLCVEQGFVIHVVRVSSVVRVLQGKRFFPVLEKRFAGWHSLIW